MLRVVQNTTHIPQIKIFIINNSVGEKCPPSPNFVKLGYFPIWPKWVITRCAHSGKRWYGFGRLSGLFNRTHTVEPSLTTTPFIRPPRYYDHILSNQT